MKKSQLPLFIAFLFAIQSLSAQNLLLPILRDSSHSYYFDSETGAEQFKSFAYFTYNSDKLSLEDLFINFFGTDKSYYRYNYEYNAEKLLSKSTSLNSTVSASGPWQNFLKDEYSYDAQGRNTHYIGQFGNAGGGWDNYYQETFGFDDANHRDSSLYELWNAAIPAWGNYRRYYTQYLPDGNLKEHEEDEWDMDDLAWNNLLDENYGYLPDGKLNTYNSTSYDINLFTFTRNDSFVYRLDGKVDTTFSRNESSFSGDTNYVVTKSEYDPAGNLIQNTVLLKAQGSSEWEFSARQTYVPGDGYYSNDPAQETQALFNAGTHTFDVIWEIFRSYTVIGSDQLLYQEVHTQKDNNGVLAVQSIDSVWYNLPTVRTNTPVPASQVNCRFANPFKPGNCVVCDAPDANALMNIRISSITGQVVAQGRIMPGTDWRPNTDMPAGSYFLTAWQNGKYLGQKKMVVGN